MSQYVTTIVALAGLIVDVLVSDRDSIIVITGYPGVGKSVFTYQLAVETAKKITEAGLADCEFMPVRDMLFSRDEFKEWLELPIEYRVGDADEVVGIFYSRDYHDESQISLLKKLDRIRDRHLVLPLLIPNFFHIDKHIRDARVMYWIHIDKRVGKGKDGYAHAYIYQKEDNEFSQDPWNLAYNRKLKAQGKISSSPNYVGEIVFKDMDQRFYSMYKKIKALKRDAAEIEEWAGARARKRKYGQTGERLDRRLKA